MQHFIRIGWAALLFSPWVVLYAQDLAPRAYVITPKHSNAVVLTWSFFNGSINLNGAFPISDAKGSYTIPIFSYYHSFGIFGRSANIVATLPYGIGNFQGTQSGVALHRYRSGLTDSVYRFSVNLKGGPAMDAKNFTKWRQKIILGAGIKVVAPTGQYDSGRLLNWGTNRWSFKPEFGYSERWGKWVVDSYAGAWFFTTNHNFFPGNKSNSQSPMAAFESHLSYDFKPRYWVSLDGNFWVGGSTRVGAIENPNTEQRNSRLGGTASVPISKHQSLKFSYNRGTYIQFGGNYNNVSLAWQYGWLGRPN
jgi:hypothetical protein